MELIPNAITNVGIGVPEGISMVTNEELLAREMKITWSMGQSAESCRRFKLLNLNIS